MFLTVVLIAAVLAEGGSEAAKQEGSTTESDKEVVP